MKKIIKHYTDTLNYELEKTARLMRMLSIQLFEKLEIVLNIDEYAALDTISCNESICQRDLAKLILKDRANTGRIIKTLEEKGLITRFISTKNNRLVRKMSITETGYEMLRTINKKIENYVYETKQIVAEQEVAAICTSLKRLRERFENLIELKI